MNFNQLCFCKFFFGFYLLIFYLSKNVTYEIFNTCLFLLPFSIRPDTIS